MEVSRRLIEALRNARSVAVMTGAGVSAESGVPTFRDAQTGLWSTFRAEDLATPEAFRRDPKTVWEWYALRREMMKTVEPNPGHRALAELERRVSRFTLITQNIDNLHSRAGSRNVLELHGNIFRTKCFAEDTVVDEWLETGEVPPRCPKCGSYLRPDVVWFGEMLPTREMAEAVKASQTCEAFFSIGTSGIVYPAAGLAYEAIRHGAFVVEINPDETPLSVHAGAVLTGPSGEILPHLLSVVWPDAGG
jgi:NAD-dependent deacetylase